MTDSASFRAHALCYFIEISRQIEIRDIDE